MTLSLSDLAALCATPDPDRAERMRRRDDSRQNAIRALGPRWALARRVKRRAWQAPPEAPEFLKRKEPSDAFELTDY